MRSPDGLTRRARENVVKGLLITAAPALLAMIFLLPPAGASAKSPRAVPGAPTLPKGTVLYLHLQSAVSTSTSKQGQPITASLAREVIVQDEIAIPFGSTLTGSVEKCAQPGASDQRAVLLLNFRQITIPGEGNFNLNGYVSGVSNARETMLADGTIQGVLESETPASLLSGVLGRLGQANSTINDQIQKQKIGQVNTAVELPAGTDLQFTLTEPLGLAHFVASAGPGKLPADLRVSIVTILADAPNRAESKTRQPGDPINLVLVGTHQEIEQAFSKAGWTEPKTRNEQSIWKTTEAVINDDGYNVAPVSDLYLFGRKQDLAFEKTLNTFNKRHHLRLWQTTATTADDRPIWLGAATHDIGIDVHPGVVSHATDPDLDDERAQVGSDLFIGGAVQAAELIAPANPLTSGMTATGGKWHTDGRLFVIQLKS